MKMISLLKIDTKYRRNQLPIDTQMQLDYFPINQVKFLTSTITFLLIDLIFLIPMLASGVKIFLYITIPLVIIINLWSIALLIRKSEKTRHETLLFYCFSGIAGSICFFLLSLMYAWLGGIDATGYYLFMTLLFIFTIVWFFYKQLVKYGILKREEKKLIPPWQSYLFSISIPGAYIISQFIMDLNKEIVLMIMMIVYAILTLLFIIIFTKSLHKYLFIKNNVHLLKNS